VRATLRLIGSEVRNRDYVEALDWLGIGSLEDTLTLVPYETRYLSVMAMISDTALLVVDEPNIELRGDKMIKLVEKPGLLASQGMAIVIISHDERLRRVAHREVVMTQGIS
jgi:ABC-type sugar transport system ATPase subunit